MSYPPLSFLDRRMPLTEALERVSLESLTEHMGVNIVCWDVYGAIVSYDDSWEAPAKLFDVRATPGGDAYVDRAWKTAVSEASKGDLWRMTATATLRDMGPMGKWLSIHIESDDNAERAEVKPAEPAPPKGLKIRRKPRGRVTIKR